MAQEDVMANQGNKSFEIPTEMRTFAEKSVEQARQAFDSFMTAAQAAANSADKQASGARTGARQLGELAVGFAERNIASSFEFAQKLVRAKDSDEVLALQADYVKGQMAALNEQASELGKRAARMAGQSVES
jgi:phasin